MYPLLPLQRWVRFYIRKETCTLCILSIFTDPTRNVWKQSQPLENISVLNLHLLKNHSEYFVRLFPIHSLQSSSIIIEFCLSIQI